MTNPAMTSPTIVELIIVKLPSEVGTDVPEGAALPLALAEPETCTDDALYATLGTPNSTVSLYTAVIPVPLEHRSDDG